MWVLLSLFSALGDATLVIKRKQISPDIGAFDLALVQTLLTALLLLIPLPFVWNTVHLYDMSVLIGVRSLLSALSVYLLFVALRSDHVSTLMPITALSPALVMVMDVFLTGHLPTVWGMVGVCCIVVGTFLIMKQHKLDTGLFLTPGIIPISLVTILWSCEVVIHGIVTREISPLLYLALSQTLVALILTVWGVCFLRTRFNWLRTLPWRDAHALGTINVAALIAQMYAQSIGIASYVVALKRTSILFTMIGARAFLNERITGKIIPAFLAILGVGLIVVLG